MPPRRKASSGTAREGAAEAAGEMAGRASARLRELEQSGEGAGEYDGACDGELRDFSGLTLKPDHANRPLWVCPDGSIYLEASSKLYLPAYDFVVAIAEPVARPEFVHQYRLTPYSLYAAVSVGVSPADILSVLEKLSKVNVAASVSDFIADCTKNYGRAKLVLRGNRHYVESEDAEALRDLLRNDGIRAARDLEAEKKDAGEKAAALEEDAEFAVGEAQPEMKANRTYLALARQIDNDDEEEEEEVMDDATEETIVKKTLSFALLAGSGAEVKRIAAKELDFPLVEEYDFRRDATNALLPIELRPSTRIRNYQEKSLSKMFGNGRARSGIIVLPCGAGKTLTAIVAASTVKRSTLVLCTNATAVAQWKAQFMLWTNLEASRVSLFTSDVKEQLHPECGVLITTYSMVSLTTRRSAEGEKLINEVKNREWGLMLLDEVHVVPAATFRRVLAVCNAHCKLGLTATLVREDDLITDLNFLIGPKLYEANWMDLTHAGHLANVQCVEVWCQMTAAFYREYLRAGGTTAAARQQITEDDDDNNNNKKQSNSHADIRRQRLLYVLNPHKFRAAEYLVKYHEARGDKVILFSDDIYCLMRYSKALNRPAIHGGTKEQERQAILGSFRFNSIVNTVCLSKVGDVAIDLPEANVIVQVSSHFGSRRQEAQRLGRILRAKPNAQGDGFNAYFYTLVSTDTSEMFYSAKRQQYLVDQGYTFKVVTDLPNAEDSCLDTKEQELDLLTSVLSAEYLKEEEAEEKALKQAAKDDLHQEQGPKRSMVTMSKLSGADGARYLEFDASNPTGQAKQAPKRNKIFTQRGR